MDRNEVEKAKALNNVEIIDYIPHSVVIKTIIKKPTGNIRIMSFDSCDPLTGKISPFDTFIQIIDGVADIVIDGRSNLLNTGQSIVIPAHTSNVVRSRVPFKMISTVIKSGYE